MKCARCDFLFSWLRATFGPPRPSAAWGGDRPAGWRVLPPLLAISGWLASALASAKPPPLTDEELAERFIFDAANACAEKEYDDCASLARRALIYAPKDPTATQLRDIAKRRGGRGNKPRSNPGFTEGMTRIGLVNWNGGFADHAVESDVQILVGHRLLGDRFITQLEIGPLLGNYAPYGLRVPPSEDGEPSTMAYFPRQFGIGGGFGATIGFAFMVSKTSSVEILASPGFRFVWLPGEEEIFSYLDLGFGPAYQYGRLTFELKARTSWSGSDGETSSVFWGMSAGFSLAFGPGR